ncbi:glycosyl transferase [Streptomyces sp. Root63]|uniref:ArnT family glycosyltransferase n=1 Tax=unclassified Streptomyces TaxID=2593676 RepID=UPI0006FDCC42|nr:MULTISPECIES: glycosyltransferase family 39 protein [unclassified Streptomyces]KQX37502.1 glycosyl transferase [Streptomyces sp. Root1295]KRA43432.1 glycosyl transferase [Streptomyces sp. Root63]
MTTTAAVPPIPVPAPPPRPSEPGPGPRWARPALYGLLLAVGLAYFWNLSASGYANSFYSAAVQAGSQSWKALFFGSLDSANAITVDKPPAALWPMALSVRLFGLNSWAILAPQVLMALATGAVLNTAVRRRFGPVAGLIAVGVFALTPVAALMFRFNNPDALLALLMTVTVWCVLRALEQGRTTWLLWAGAAVGFAFLTKTLQAFLILPPLAVLYAVCAPVPVRKRLGQLAVSTLTMVVAGGWWVAIVELMPASSRPYVGGSQNNSFLELTFGYNGLGRINGEETGSVGGGGRGGGGGGGWGDTGIGRMFNSEIGGQIAWLLPAALILLAAGLWLTRKAARTDSARAAFVAWGGALIMTAAVFSFMAGIFHQYYTVALAPYVAALVAMGVTVLWEERGAWWPRAVLAGTVVVTVVWAYVLLGRTPDYLPWLRWTVLAAGLVGALGLLVAGRFGGRGLAAAVVGLSCAASLAGPAAYTVSTLNSGHQGSIVTAGPSAGFGMGGPGGGGGRGGPGGPGGGDGGQRGGMQQPPGQGRGTPPGQGQGNQQGNQQGNAPGGMPTAPGGTAPGGTAPGGTGTGTGAGTNPGSGEGMRGGGGGGMGGLLNGASVDAEAKALLEKGADDYTWVAAAVGAQNAASYQLATGDPVMAIGGFNGSDPSPTLAQFKKYVAEGKIHYFVSGGGMGGGTGGGREGGGGGMGGDSGTSSQISSWVTENFTEVTVGSATFYDLTQPAG